MTVARDIPHSTPRHEDPATPPFREQVAAELRAHLARRRLSGRALAKLLDENQTWVSRRLAGQVPLDVDDIQRIAEALGLTPLELLGAPFGPAAHRGTAPLTDRVTDRINLLCSPRGLADVIPFPRVPSACRAVRSGRGGTRSGSSGLMSSRYAA